MKGERMEPIRDIMVQQPMPWRRTSVGNSSTQQRQTTWYVLLIHIRPVRANTITTVFISVQESIIIIKFWLAMQEAYSTGGGKRPVVSSLALLRPLICIGTRMLGVANVHIPTNRWLKILPPLPIVTLHPHNHKQTSQCAICRQKYARFDT